MCCFSMEVTIRELAARCGLSVSTVSKALNGYAEISEETRSLVVAAAKEAGYIPNAHARALKAKQSYNLGVLFSDDKHSGLTHAFFSTVLESFKQEAERRGYDVTFISHNIGSTQMTYLEHCRYREVDGICIACIDFWNPEVIQLAGSKLPLVTIDHQFNGRMCIQSDNIQGIDMLVRHVYGKGHRRIAYIHGRRSTVTDMRLVSFHRTAQSLGLDIPEHWLKECHYNDPASVYEAAKQLLQQPNRPTCILVSDDFAALGALEAAGEMGLKVPEDISITGYDGIALTQLIKPKLTTIKQDTVLMGTEAARTLTQLIESPKTTIPETIVIPCTLIEGETVAAPQ